MQSAEDEFGALHEWINKQSSAPAGQTDRAALRLRLGGNLSA